MASCRPGGLEEKLAVFCCRGKDFADELAYLVDLLVSGGKGLCYLWAKTHAAEDPVDGVVPAGEGFLWSGGGGGLAACPGPPRFVCGRWGWLKSRARSPWVASGAESSGSGRAWPI